MAPIDKTYIRFVCFQSIGRQRSRLGLFKAMGKRSGANTQPDGRLLRLAA